jgi:putative transposase
VKTLQVRIKDKHAAVLNTMASEVNLVWNFCNELSHRYIQRTGKFLSGYDLQKYTAGATRAGLILNAASVQMVGAELATRRRLARKSKLSWRVSGGSRRSLGWIPFRSDTISYANGQLRYAGHHFGLWDSFGLTDYTLGSGSFSQDSRGRWYANILVNVTPLRSRGTASIGIDLGLKDFATMSDDTKVEAQQIYREAESKLVIAQRANKQSKVKALHAQIRNRRKDFLHKLSTELVSQNSAIFIGNANASKLAKTTMAKSVLDAGWSMFRIMLKYKSIATGVLFEEVDEAFSTQTCSACGCLPESRPKGIAGLGIREWTCTECGGHHKRDVNAARNILAAGHRRLAVGITTVREDVNPSTPYMGLRTVLGSSCTRIKNS